MNTFIKKTKLKGNESFNIREGWLRKGVRNIEQYPNLFSRDDVMELLGVGSKMVKSIRYWLQATGLCVEMIQTGGRARVQALTKFFGVIINTFDPYFDDDFTWALLHYNIVKNEDLCIAWNVFYNSFDGEDFSREEMIKECEFQFRKRIDTNFNYSPDSFKDDCSSIIRMYLESDYSDEPEENLGSPFSGLGLLKKSSKNTYRKTSPSFDVLDKLAILYVIVCNLDDDKTSVSIDELVESPNNIGRIFNLNKSIVNEYLDQLRISEYITINRTAGLDMVYINEELTPEGIMTEYYNSQMR